MAAIATAFACSSPTTGPGRQDAGIADALRPPDLNLADAVADAVVSAVGQIGAACDIVTGSGCPAMLTCLAVDVERGVGVCARAGCTPEDVSTSVREDDCPVGSACAELPPDSYYCLASCQPSATASTSACKNSSMACDPLSVLFTGYIEVCLLPACDEDADCNEVVSSPAQATCAENGVCFVDPGASGATVGSPCKTRLDCGRHQFCLAERDVGGSTRVYGGYCTIVGCRHQGPWSCPDGSGCYSLGGDDSLSLCLRTGCKPGEGCRPDAPKGQYQCLEVNAIGVCWIDPR